MFRIALALAVSTPAFAADLIGRDGLVREVTSYQNTADTFLQHNGAVVIESIAGLEEYKWGGSACSNRQLSEHHVAMLQRALESGATVTPRYKTGQGTNRCLVGFSVSFP